MDENSVIFVSPDPTWPSRFIVERECIHTSLPNLNIEHIGSTSIPGLAAKPIIDILCGVTSLDMLNATTSALEKLGYVHEGSRPGHRWLCSPNPHNRQVILHVVVFGDAEWLRRLAFRDYLRSHPNAVRAYETLKRNVAELYSNDLNAYTAAKAEFVASIVARSEHPRKIYHDAMKSATRNAADS